MAKQRTHNPNREKVLKEFDNLCAICLGTNPEVHHIDENPSNHETNNLIPLCSNFHKQTQHNPYKKIEPQRLRLFRIFKEPKFLLPQFKPIYSRIAFLDDVSKESDHKSVLSNANDLVEFVSSLEMGDYFSKKISQLISRKFSGIWYSYPTHDTMITNNLPYKGKEDADYIERVINSKNKVYEFIMQLLQYQQWNAEIDQLCGKCGK